jgi:hypothetical protein
MQIVRCNTPNRFPDWLADVPGELDSISFVALSLSTFMTSLVDPADVTRINHRFYA